MWTDVVVDCCTSWQSHQLNLRGIYVYTAVLVAIPSPVWIGRGTFPTVYVPAGLSQALHLAEQRRHPRFLSGRACHAPGNNVS